MGRKWGGFWCIYTKFLVDHVVVESVESFWGTVGHVGSSISNFGGKKSCYLAAVGQEV